MVFQDHNFGQGIERESEKCEKEERKKREKERKEKEERRKEGEEEDQGALHDQKSDFVFACILR